MSAYIILLLLNLLIKIESISKISTLALNKLSIIYCSNIDMKQLTLN